MAAPSTGRDIVPSTRADEIAGFISAIRSDVLHDLVAHWHRMRGSRLMPARADFDPLEVRRAIGYISLIEVQRDPLRFYFRLDGTKQVDLFGIDCTRRFLNEAVPPDHAALATQSYLEVVEGRAPRYHRRTIPFHERLITYEAVILPFSSDGERIDILMTGVVPDHPL